jgi:succinate dehydrogenase / fumarate reductase membrane anchor subunit
MSDPKNSGHRDVGARSAQDWKKSARHGAGTWLAERFYSLVLVPLTAWAAWAGFKVCDTRIGQVKAFIAQPLHALLISLTVAVAIWHMYLGLRTVIEDYFDQDEGRGVVLFVAFLLSLVLLIASLGSIYLIYLESHA